jgi:serpin B
LPVTIAVRRRNRRAAIVKKLFLALSLLTLGVAARAGTVTVSPIADANNRFCLDLYGRLRGEPGNLAFSPYSISSALAMTYAGARGRTEEEMARVLHLPFGQDSTHAAFSMLRTALLEMASARGCTLSVANRLWGQESARFLSPFLETTRDAYGAELERLDFVHRSEDSRRRINDWTSEQTRRMIPDLLPPGSIHDLTRLVLTNAIYFKARWQGQFEGGVTTREAFFYPSNAETLNVPMMHRLGGYPHARGEGLQILVMSYACSVSSMVILLPDSIDGLGKLESGLSAERIESWIAETQERQVLLALPRFRVTSSFSLGDALSNLGMSSALSMDDADFSGMDGERDLFISAVVHKTVVDVAEKGTEAAAATAVVMLASARELSPERPVSFTADHPFLFLIRDDRTGCILFIGRVTNPLL